MAASAMHDPETPPMRVERMTFTWAREPRMCPTRTFARSNSRPVIPEPLSRFPAKMNSGTASRAKFWVWDTVSWMGIVKGRFRF